MRSHLPIDVASFSLDHENASGLEPIRWGRPLVLALVLTAAACSAAWLVENDKLGRIIDGTLNDSTAPTGHAAA